MCSGHPTGMWESSRSPSPFCSMIVPSIGTSIVALRLTCARLHFHASGTSKPREASNASAGNSGWSFIGSTSSLITSLRPCSGWGCPLVRLQFRTFGHRDVFEPGGADRLYTYCTGGTRVLDAFPAQAVVDRRIIHAGTKTVVNWTFQMTCRFCGLISGVMHLTWPSMTRVYDSDRSNDAVTFKPRYSSLNSTREALLSEAGFEKVFRTQNWVRRSKLFCRWFCFLLGQAGCISVAAWTHLSLASYYFVASGGLIVCR